MVGKMDMAEPERIARHRGRRSRTNWSELLPHHVAASQERWERDETLLAMRTAGMSLQQAAGEVGISEGYAAQRLTKHSARRRLRNGDKSPAERYLSKTAADDVREMSVRGHGSPGRIARKLLVVPN